MRHLTQRIKPLLLIALLGIAAVGCGESNSNITALTNNSSNVITPDPATATGGEVTDNTRASLNVTLSWTPPSTRADGTPIELSEIWGYEIVSIQNDETITTVTVPAADIT